MGFWKTISDSHLQMGQAQTDFTPALYGVDEEPDALLALLVRGCWATRGIVNL